MSWDQPSRIEHTAVHTYRHSQFSHCVNDDGAEFLRKALTSGTVSFDTMLKLT